MVLLYYFNTCAAYLSLHNYILYILLQLYNPPPWRDSPQWALASSFTRFLDHTQRHTTVGRTHLDE